MAADPGSTGHALDSSVSAGLHAVPLFHAAWLFCGGIVIVHGLWLRPSLTLLALGIVGALCALAALCALRMAWVPLAVLWLLLGAWCAEMEPHPASAPELTRFSDGLLRTVEGTAVGASPLRNEVEENVDQPMVAATSQRIDLRVATVEEVTDDSDRQIPVSGGVRLTLRWPESAQVQPFRCGEKIRVIARLLPPETYHDAGVWSWADYLLDQGITSTGSASIDRVERLGASRDRTLACRVREWQNATTARLLALPAGMRSLPAPLRLSQDDAIMLAAMVAGDRTFLTRSLRVGFERTGSFHMLVVSGFHLAIVAGCLFWLAQRLRLPRLPATLITIAASFGYALFTGFATPVQRSLWMITLYLLGRLIYRERSPLNVIGFAALCLLVVSPRSLFDASFQMTLLAVAVIAGIAMPLLRGTAHPYLTAARDLRRLAIDAKLAPPLAAYRVALRMIAAHLQRAAGSFAAWRLLPFAVRTSIRVVELVVVSCVVELAMTLPMAFYFHRITLLALPVNILILPLLAVLMPAALLTLPMLFVWPTAAVLPALLVVLVLHAGVGLVHLFGAMALGDFRIPGPMPWQWAAFCLLIATAIALAHRGTSSPWSRRAACSVLLLAGAIAVAPRPVNRPPGALLVEAIDVGQGDSLLVITPDGKTLLVDAGGFGGGPRQAAYSADENLPAGVPAAYLNDGGLSAGTAPERDFDIGEEVVSEALWSRGIRHLDAVALTHTDSDHMGGMPAVLHNFHPDALWVGENPSIPLYRALLAEAAALHVPAQAHHAGDAFTFGATQVRVLSPFPGVPVSRAGTNANMLVLHVAYGATSVLLEGDAEAPTEDAMLAEPDLKSTLLKVGHHGSVTSTRPEFLARVAPQWAVISCGLHNRYGHPREEVLAALQAAQARTFRTDIEGASCFVLDGKVARPDYACGWRNVVDGGDGLNGRSKVAVPGGRNAKVPYSQGNSTSQ